MTPMILIRTITLIGIAGGVTLGGTVVTADTVGPDTHVSLGVACGVTGAMLSAAFMISRKITQWEDRLAGFEKRFDALPCVKERTENEICQSVTRHFTKPKP